MELGNSNPEGNLRQLILDGNNKWGATYLNTTYREAVENYRTCNIEDFNSMFQSTNFDGNLSGWDVSNGISFSGMFQNATSFNSDLSGWDVSSGTILVVCFTMLPVSIVT